MTEENRAEGIQDQIPALNPQTMAKTQTKQLVVCIDNNGYAVSLEKRKIYVALRDSAAEKHGLLRIVDEPGEDYLYRKSRFARSLCRWL
jgi:TPP-dependent pyruvate/acetoin dehydrogenase alpha subunit